MKNTKRMLIYITLTLTLLFSSVSVYAAKKMTVTITKSVTVKKKTLNIGAKRQLVVKKGKKVIKAAKLKFKTSNKKVVEVSKKGLLKAKKVGKATVTITYKKKRVKLNIKVIRPVKAVKLNKNTLNLSKGDKKTLTAAVSPKNATNKGVKWSSSNENVATVTNGVVTANENGTSVITATSSQGGKTGTCVVSVSSGTSSEGNTNTGVTTPASTAVGWASWKKGGVKLKNSGQIACYCTDDESSKGIKSKIAEAILTGDYTYNDIEWKIVGGDTDILDIEPYLWYLKGSGKKAGSCEVGVFIKGDPSGACQDKVTIVVESHSEPTPVPTVEEKKVTIDGIIFDITNIPDESADSCYIPYSADEINKDLFSFKINGVDSDNLLYAKECKEILQIENENNSTPTYFKMMCVYPSMNNIASMVTFRLDAEKLSFGATTIKPHEPYTVSLFYNNKLIKTVKILKDNYEKNYYQKIADDVMENAWKAFQTISTKEEKFKLAAEYLMSNYSYSQVDCKGGATVMAIVAVNLGLRYKLGYEYYDIHYGQGIWQYTGIFNCSVPGGHTYGEAYNEETGKWFGFSTYQGYKE